MKLKTFLLSAGFIFGMLTTANAQTAQHDSIRVKIMKDENGVITNIDTAVLISQHDQLMLWLELQGIELPPPPPPPPMPGDSMKQFMIVRTIELDSMPPNGEFRIPPPPTPPGTPLPPGSRETFIMRTPPPPPGHEGEVRIIVCDTMKHKEYRKVIVNEKAPGSAKRPATPKEVRTPDNELVVYPNPSSGHITIDINMPGKGKTDITITDMNGKTVYTEQLPESDTKVSKQVDLGKNGKGMYSVRVSKNGKVIVEQIVVE